MYDSASSSEPAPPPYELSRELYDFKTAEALRRSTTVLRDTEVDQDGFEVWNEDAYQSNARALKFAQDSENVGSTSAQSSTRYSSSSSALPPFTSSSKEKERMADEKGKGGYSYGGTQPLNIQKRPAGIRALPTPPVPRIETASISNYPPEKSLSGPGPRSPTSSSVTESEDGVYQPRASSSRQFPASSPPELPAFSAIDAYPGTTLLQGADLGRAPTYVERPPARPRHSLPSPQTPTNYPPMNQPMERPRGGRASVPPQATPTISYTQPVPPPPPVPPARAEFNNRGPVVQFDPVKAAYKAPSTFGNLPRDPVTHAPNAAALYSSHVASFVAPKPPPPNLPAHRRVSTFGAYPPPAPSQLLPPPPPPTPGYAPGQLPPGAGTAVNPSARSLTPQQQHYAPVAGQYYPPQGGYYPQQQQPNQYYTQTPQPPPPPPVGAYSRPMSTYPQQGWHPGQYGR